MKEDTKKEVAKSAIQFIKFGIVGMSNTIISLVVYYILVFFGINYIVANVIGFVVSVFNAYYWNSKHVFKVSENVSKLKSFMKVFASYGGSYVFSLILLVVLVDLIGISEYIAPLLKLVITVPINFVLNKFWAFKEKK